MQADTGENLGLSRSGSGRNLREDVLGASMSAAVVGTQKPMTGTLMELVVARDNMRAALQRVQSNGGAAGIDTMTVGELPQYLVQQWERVKAELLEDRYKPQAVRIVEIPKPDGGVRKLGIPTVKDRLIQQAMLQVLSPIFEPLFSDSSYGFRPGRSAHQALEKALEYATAGKRYVVDIDLEKFFDNVNHDILMSRVARVIEDKRILRLIRRYLQAGALVEGVVIASEEGTPQGSPLSPLLSNIMLDELDKELERRGHFFVRYADDCNIYVATERAGQRVMESITEYLGTKLRLKVNKDKSAVGHISKRTFLGYTMTQEKPPRLKVSKKSVKRFKDKVRSVFKRARGRSINSTIAELNPILRGWISYFSLSHVKGTIEDLDSWIRHRLRSLQWELWKTRQRRCTELIKCGTPHELASLSAGNGRGTWYNGGAAHMHFAQPLRYFYKLGLITMTSRIT